MPQDETTRLRLAAPRSGTVVETADYLFTLDSCYRHLSAFHEWIDDVTEGEWRRWGPFPAFWLPPLSPDVLAETEPVIRIAAVQLGSPGFWEFLGALNPLETIRKYLVDRNERRKDREWREPLEAERLRLENERLRTQAAAERIQLLHNAGLPRSVIRRAVAAHVIQPLGTLDRFQDVGLIGGVLQDRGSDPPASPHGRRVKRKITLEDDDTKEET